MSLLMLGLGFALLALIGLVPLILTPKARTTASQNPMDIYLDQLADIDSDIAGEQLNEQDAATARLEIERRMLRTVPFETDGEGSAGAEDNEAPRAISMRAILTAVMLLTVTLYSLLGRPDLPAQPGSRVAAMDEQIMPNGLTYGQALARVQARLAETPDDQQGWVLLARTAMILGEFQEADRAYEKLISFGDPDGQWRSLQLEAYLAMTRGRFSPAAELIADTLATDHPNNPLPDLYRGYDHIQNKDFEAALAVWQGLLDRTPDDAPWRPRLTEELDKLKAELNPAAK